MANELTGVINQIRRELTNVGNNFFSFRNAAKQNDDKLFDITKDAYNAIKNNKKSIEDVQNNFSDLRDKHNEIREKTASVERNLNDVIRNQKNISDKIEDTNRNFDKFRRSVSTNFVNIDAKINDFILSQRNQEERQTEPAKINIPESAYKKDGQYGILEKIANAFLYRNAISGGGGLSGLGGSGRGLSRLGGLGLLGIGGGAALLGGTTEAQGGNTPLPTGGGTPSGGSPSGSTRGIKPKEPKGEIGKIPQDLFKGSVTTRGLSVDPNADTRNKKSEDGDVTFKTEYRTRRKMRKKGEFFGRKPGNRTVFLDFNAYKKNSKGWLMVVPDDITKEELKKVREHRDKFIKLAKKYGYDNYKISGRGKYGPGILTTSENGRGVPGTFHTEPGFANDPGFRKLYSNPDFIKDYSILLGETLGKLPGTTFQRPHGDKNSPSGAGMRLTDGTYVTERSFAGRILKELDDYKKGKNKKSSKDNNYNHLKKIGTNLLEKFSGKSNQQVAYIGLLLQKGDKQSIDMAKIILNDPSYKKELGILKNQVPELFDNDGKLNLSPKYSESTTNQPPKQPTITRGTTIQPSEQPTVSESTTNVDLANVLRKKFETDHRNSEIGKKAMGENPYGQGARRAIFRNNPGGIGGKKGVSVRPWLKKYSPLSDSDEKDYENKQGSFKVVGFETYEEGSAALLGHYLNANQNGKLTYIGKTLKEANSIWTGGNPYIGRMKSVGLDPNTVITKEKLKDLNFVKKLIRFHMFGEASTRGKESKEIISDTGIKNAHLYFMLKENLITPKEYSKLTGITINDKKQDFMSPEEAALKRRLEKDLGGSMDDADLNPKKIKSTNDIMKEIEDARKKYEEEQKEKNNQNRPEATPRDQASVEPQQPQQTQQIETTIAENFILPTPKNSYGGAHNSQRIALLNSEINVVV